MPDLKSNCPLCAAGRKAAPAATMIEIVSINGNSVSSRTYLAANPAITRALRKLKETTQ